MRKGDGIAREIHNVPVAMRPGLRECNEARLRVSMASVVPDHMKPFVREITELFVPVEHRRKKLATMLMNFTCQEADANRITLLLTATPEDSEGLDQDQLVAWYQRFGFTVLPRVEGAPYMMARQVYEKPRIIRSPVLQAVREIIGSGY